MKLAVIGNGRMGRRIGAAWGKEGMFEVAGDVGQGDGLCVRTKDEQGECTILIDGGSSSKKSVGQNIEIPFRNV